jgi:hypothetical protein
MAKRRKHKRPHFLAERLALWAATLVLAGFGAAGWTLAFWDVSHHLAIMAALVALVAPLVAAALSGPAMHGGGVLAWLTIIVFTAMEAGSHANAIWQFDAVANQAVNERALTEYQAEADKVTAARDEAQAKLAALPTPDATGAIRKADTYVATHAVLTANLETAQARVDALVKPEPKQLFPRWLSGGVMALTAFALIFGHLAIARAERQMQRKAEAQAQAARAPVKQASRKPRRKAAPAGPNVVIFKSLAEKLSGKKAD